jgi:hypothetical protein
MHLVTEQSVRSYLANDPTSASMDAFSSDGDADLVCQKWLRDSAPTSASNTMRLSDG